MSSIAAKTLITEEIKTIVLPEEERCTILHCRNFTKHPTKARIWNSIYLIEEDQTKRKLIKAFKISMMPEWTWFYVYNDYYYFTLVFEGLSKTCQNFYLFEDIPEPGGFYSDTILRNEIDVYQLELKS